MQARAKRAKSRPRGEEPSESERIQMLKQKLLEYRKRKQNDWKSPRSGEKRNLQAKGGSGRKGKKKRGGESGSGKKGGRAAGNFYDAEPAKEKGAEGPGAWLPQSSKFDYYMHRKAPDADTFELTGLEAQIIKSAFMETDEQKPGEAEGRAPGESLEGDLLPQGRSPEAAADSEVTGEYIRSLKKKFENWHSQSEALLNREIGQSETFGPKKASALNEKLFLTNPRGSGDAGAPRRAFLRKKDYEGQLEGYRNQNLRQSRRSENCVAANRSVVGGARGQERIRPGKGPLRSKSTVFKRLAKVGESKAQKMQRMREEYRSREMENCTFRPNLRKAGFRKRRSASCVGGRGKKPRAKAKTPAKSGDVGNRLFTEAKRKEERMRRRKEEKERRELEEIEANLKKGKSR